MEPLQCCSVASHCSKEQRHNIPTFFLEKYVQCDASTEFLMITSIWLFLGSSLSSLLVTALLMMESNWWKLNVPTNSWKNWKYSLLRRKSITFHYIIMLLLLLSALRNTLLAQHESVSSDHCISHLAELDPPDGVAEGVQGRGPERHTHHVGDHQ